MWCNTLGLCVCMALSIYANWSRPNLAVYFFLWFRYNQTAICRVCRCWLGSDYMINIILTRITSTNYINKQHHTTLKLNHTHIQYQVITYFLTKNPIWTSDCTYICTYIPRPLIIVKGQDINPPTSIDSCSGDTSRDDIIQLSRGTLALVCIPHLRVPWKRSTQTTRNTYMYFMRCTQSIFMYVHTYTCISMYVYMMKNP